MGVADRPQRAGDRCKMCGEYGLRNVKGAIVCPKCDHAAAFPNVRRGDTG